MRSKPTRKCHLAPDEYCIPSSIKLVAKSIGSEAIAVGECREGPGKELGPCKILAMTKD